MTRAVSACVALLFTVASASAKVTPLRPGSYTVPSCPPAPVCDVCPPLPVCAPCPAMPEAAAQSPVLPQPLPVVPVASSERSPEVSSPPDYRLAGPENTRPAKQALLKPWQKRAIAIGSLLVVGYILEHQFDNIWDDDDSGGGKRHHCPYGDC